MRRIIPLMVLFSLAVASLAACVPGAAVAGQPKEFTSETGGFSIMPPYPLKETTESVDTAVGTIEIHMFQAEHGSRAWMVGYSEYPAEVIEAGDPQMMLAAARHGAVSNVNGELVSDVEVALGEFPGREYIISGQRQGEVGLRTRARIFLVGNRLYQVVAVTPEGEERSEEVENYLDSFRLTGN